MMHGQKNIKLKSSGHAALYCI